MSAIVYDKIYGIENPARRNDLLCRFNNSLRSMVVIFEGIFLEVDREADECLKELRAQGAALIKTLE